MCGICGIVHFDDDRRVDENTLRRMASTLAHRGPDGEGFVFLGQAGLAHRRLSIIDLATGNQPMFNEDRSIAIVFNGEIYNFKELRPQLEAKGHIFATRSDTEVILHLYEEYGRECTRHLRGMFAFAIWDTKSRTLFVACDRVGKKPLYFACADNSFYFASELKALLGLPGVERRLRRSAIHEYLSLQYVPAPETVFEGIHKLPAANRMLVKDIKCSPEMYWELDYDPKLDVTQENAIENCDALIEEAVKLRLESDVPLGAFLSGGIDSSLVVAMMRKHISGPLRTFSIGFEHEKYNELPFARTISERFETEHHEFTVKADALEVLPKLVWHFDEPFADHAALPTYYLAQLTREFVTVALNGDGGDESFAGYDRYLGGWFKGYGQYLRVPAQVRSGLIAPALRWAGAAFPENWSVSKATFVNAISLSSPAVRFVQRLVVFQDWLKRRLYTPEFANTVGAGAALQTAVRAYERSGLSASVDRMLNTDVKTYLPGALLPKVDRTTMAVGLEGRSPLLDHVLMEYAARLPHEFKVRSGETKSLLKQLALRHLPEDIVFRKKHGFLTPVGVWLRNNKNSVAHELLLSDRALQRGIFSRQGIQKLLAENSSGAWNHDQRLWALLFLEVWFRTYMDPATSPSGPLDF